MALKNLSRIRIPCLSCINENFGLHPTLKRVLNVKSRYSSTQTQSKSPESTIEHTANLLGETDVDEDDGKYFKTLSKSVNSYWVSNADVVCNRLNWDWLLDHEKRKSLIESCRRRYADVDIDKILKLWNDRESCGNDVEKRAITEELVSLALWVPNETHPEAMAIIDEIPKEIFCFGEPRNEGVEEFSKFCNKLGILRDDQLGNLTYPRSYYLKGPLAELEDGLIRYSLNSLMRENFSMISVPDIVYPHIIESCGMKTRSNRDQVFWLQSQLPTLSDTAICLSGTAEMSIAGSLKDKIFKEEDLPLKFTSVSRCFRAETSSLEEERGLYRVHEFTKVEMFGVTANETGEESNSLHLEFRKIEEDNFSSLDIHFKTLEMPPSELGASAYRKFDIEAWMPGRKIYGEISSCSNCTDFQSRRLNIRYVPKHSTNTHELKYVHTVNGTACAIPRLLITLVERFQKPNGTIELPKVLQDYMPRNWEQSLRQFPKFKTRFLRTKSQQEKYVHKAN